MATLINTEVLAVEVEVQPGTDIQIATLRLKYIGEEDLESQIEQGHILKMEVPTSAPPPEE